MKQGHCLCRVSVLVLFAVLSIALAAGTASAQGVLDFTGDWTGRWENLTFGSKDSASLSVSADTSAKTLQAVLDLDGNVFGGSDPAPITLNGIYDDEGFSVSGTQAPYGDMTISGDSAGNLSGRAVNVPSAAIDSVTLAGGYTDSTISMTYIVYFAAIFGGGTANGTITMEKQITTDLPGGRADLPSGYALSEGYPNPFNPSTTVEMTLPATGVISLKIYSAAGVEVATLASGMYPPGTFRMVWQAGREPSGVYFCVLKSAGGLKMRKMALIR